VLSSNCYGLNPAPIKPGARRHPQPGWVLMGGDIEHRCFACSTAFASSGLPLPPLITVYHRRHGSPRFRHADPASAGADTVAIGDKSCGRRTRRVWLLANSAMHLGPPGSNSNLAAHCSGGAHAAYPQHRVRGLRCSPSAPAANWPVSDKRVHSP